MPQYRLTAQTSSANTYAYKKHLPRQAQVAGETGGSVFS